MNSLPIPLLLAIKNRIFILGPHLLLPRHLLFPSLQIFQRSSLFSERCINDGDDGIHRTEPFALAGFLGRGEAEGDFPVRW